MPSFQDIIAKAQKNRVYRYKTNAKGEKIFDSKAKNPEIPLVEVSEDRESTWKDVPYYKEGSEHKNCLETWDGVFYDSVADTIAIGIQTEKSMLDYNKEMCNASIIEINKERYIFCKFGVANSTTTVNCYYVTFAFKESNPNRIFLLHYFDTDRAKFTDPRNFFYKLEQGLEFKSGTTGLIPEAKKKIAEFYKGVEKSSEEPEKSHKKPIIIGFTISALILFALYLFNRCD